MNRCAAVVMLLLLAASAAAAEESARIEKLTQTALAQITNGDVGEASSTLEALRGEGYRQGYRNLSEISFALLRLAQSPSFTADLKLGTPLYLVNQALRLSPTDARVCLAAATLGRITGWGTALKNFFRGFWLAFSHPALLIGVTAELALTVLTALLLALLITAVVQIAVNAHTLFAAFGQRLPFRIRGLSTPLLFAAVLIGPMFFGILVALGIWVLFLAAFLRSARPLALTAGTSMLAAALLIPPIGKALIAVGTLPLRQAEELGRADYVPAALAPRPFALDDLFLAFGQAQSAYFRSDWPTARERFRVISEAPDTPPSVRIAALLNLSASAYQQQQFDEAQSLLEQVQRTGHESFELYFNLSQLSMARTEVTNYNQYYDQARQFSPSSWNLYSDIEQPERGMMLATYPLGEVYARFLEAENSAAELPKIWRLIGGIPSAHLVLLLGIAAIVIAFRHPTARLRTTAPPPVPSRVWAAVPYGAGLSGKQPWRATLSLALFLILLFVGLDIPVRLTALALAPTALRTAALAVAIGLFGFQILYALRARAAR